MNPQHAVDYTRTNDARQLLHTLSQAKETDKNPASLHTLPVTSAQEYGWNPATLMPPAPMFSHSKRQCDVTNYADSYFEMTGRSPYAQ